MIQHMRKIFVCFLCVCSVVIIACTAQAASSQLPEEVLDVLETKWPDWQIWEAQSEVYYSFFFKPETGYTWRVIFWKTGSASYPSGVVDMDALTGAVQRVAKNGTMPNEYIPYPDRF